MNFLLSLTLGSLLFTQSYGNFWRYSLWGCCLVNTVHFLYRLVAVEDYLSVLMLWLIISRCATSSTVNHAWERLCGCKPHPSGAASRLNKLQLQFDPDLGGSASWINNVCISSGRKLNYLTLNDHGEGHRLFPQGTRCLPVLCGGEGGWEGRTNWGMLLLHLNACQRNPSSVSFTASFHFVQNSITPSFPPSLFTFLTDTWYSWYEHSCTWQPCQCGVVFCVHALAGLCVWYE